jgi:hypothetical protein
VGIVSLNGIINYQNNIKFNANYTWNDINLVFLDVAARQAVVKIQ